MGNEDRGTILDDLKRDTQVVEARSNLASARNKLAEAEASLSKLGRPWWRDGLTVTTLAAIVAAVVPLTAQIQSCNDQEMKKTQLNFEIRNKYLDAVIRDPRQEERVLEFIVATTDDRKVEVWADRQLKKAKWKVAVLDATAALRKDLYEKTIRVVAQLADGGISSAEWETESANFWHLYRTELLPVESPDVESLMVQIGRVLSECQPLNCKAIENLSYQLARQMKAEIRADSAASIPKIIPPQADPPLAHAEN